MNPIFPTPSYILSQTTFSYSECHKRPDFLLKVQLERPAVLPGTPLASFCARPGPPVRTEIHIPAQEASLVPLS